MISKELLSEILELSSEEYVYYVGGIFDVHMAQFKNYAMHENYSKLWEKDKDSYLTITIKNEHDIEGEYYTFNIYELENKCKEWLYKRGLSLEFTKIQEHSWVTVRNENTTLYNEKYCGTEEIDIIFEVCEYIREY